MKLDKLRSTRTIRVRLLIGLLIAGIVLTAIPFYVYKSFYDMSFWQNAVSNFISTVLGLLIGIPIALLINDIQRDTLDMIEAKKRDNEVIARKNKIYAALKRELEGNLSIFHLYPDYDILSEDRFNEIYAAANTPSVVVWKSFSDGGELEWITDVELLTTLALAYHSIQIVKESGKLLVEAAYIHPPRAGKVITESANLQFKQFIAIAIIDISNALKSM